MAPKRLKFFENLKSPLLVASRGTEEASVIWQGLHEADAAFRFQVACPACGALQVMDFSRIRVPEGERDPQRILSVSLARCPCEA